MRYKNYMSGEFLFRPNRFIAWVRVNGEEVVAHVKNTGRCRELLVPNCKVGLAFSDNPNRKTTCDLVNVVKETDQGPKQINMDSQAPNQLVEEFLAAGRGQELFDDIIDWKREVCVGKSRLDFCLNGQNGPVWMEVKGCTLEEDGHCYFPDAPTERGTKHLRELKALAEKGERAAVFFVIQMEKVTDFRPNRKTDPLFASALKAANEAGVRIFAYTCSVEDESLQILFPVKICL